MRTYSDQYLLSPRAVILKSPLCFNLDSSRIENRTHVPRYDRTDSFYLLVPRISNRLITRPWISSDINLSSLQDLSMPPTLQDRLLRRELGNTSSYSAVKEIYGDRSWINDLDIVNELGGHSGCVNALRQVACCCLLQRRRRRGF